MSKTADHYNIPSLYNLELKICNLRNRPTHCKYKIIEGLTTIEAYNTIDITLATNNIGNLICNWDTNSHTLYDNDNIINNIDNNVNNPINSELDTKWVHDVSDHFAIKFDIKTKPNTNNTQTKETWRLNSKNWNKFEEMVTFLMTKWDVFYEENKDDMSKLDDIRDHSL